MTLFVILAVVHNNHVFPTSTTRLQNGQSVVQGPERAYVEYARPSFSLPLPSA